MPETDLNDPKLDRTCAAETSTVADHEGGPKTPVLDATGMKRSHRTSFGMPPVKGDFRPEKKLGEGSFGEVWLAQEWIDQRFLRRVAIKFLHGDASGEGAVAELLDEVEKLGGVGHDRGIIGVHHVETESNPPYFTMDYAPGGSLGQLLRAQGKLPPGEALAIVRQIAESLTTLHYKGIIHCDLKPDNILLTDDGKPRVADFGQARFKGRGRPNPGTWCYMAPEQMAADVSNAETSVDIYALGAIFYEMVTGLPPRFDPKHREILDAQMSTQETLETYRKSILATPAPVAHHTIKELDVPLQTIIDKCLEVAPERRFGDGAAVVHALAQRDRFNARKPLLRLTLTMTVAVLLAMLVMLTCGMPILLAGFKSTYLQESLYRDFNTARIAGHFVRDSLQDSLALAQSWAAEKPLLDAFDHRDTHALETILLELVSAQTRYSSPESSNTVVRAAAIYDHEGYCLAQVLVDDNNKPVIKPSVPELASVLWNWRDWFHGQGMDKPPRVVPYPAVPSPSISSPYRGALPNGQGTETRVTFSAPIDPPSDTDHKKRGVLAVVDRPLGMFRWTTDPELFKSGLVAIIDDDTHVIIHHGLELGGDHELTPVGPEQFPRKTPSGSVEMADAPANLMRYQGRIHEEYLPLIEKAKQVEGSYIYKDHKFNDHIDNKTYLASFCHLPESHWSVIVQHERDLALKPFYDLEWSIYLIGWISYLAGLGMLTWLWSLIFRRRHREARFLNG